MTTKKGEVLDFCKAASRRGKPAPSQTATTVSQAISHGNYNTQIAGSGHVVNVNITTKAAPKINTLPSPESIGGVPEVKTSIIERFNKLGDERKKRVGDSAYPAMYNKFKSDFKISGKWTDIWNWPIERADAIIKYLDALYDNTIQGRKERAAKREGYLPPKPQLFKKETELLAFLGYTTKSPEVKQILEEKFRVSSHASLTQVQLWQLVCHLEALVKKMVGE